MKNPLVVNKRLTSLLNVKRGSCKTRVLGYLNVMLKSKILPEGTELIDLFRVEFKTEETLRRLKCNGKSMKGASFVTLVKKYTGGK